MVDEGPAVASRVMLEVPPVVQLVDPVVGSTQGNSVARILLADDEPDLVWSLRHCLSADGYNVVTARDGVEALALARQHHPDLMILDIMMPRLDGIQICRLLSHERGLASVPILLLTAKGSIEDRLEGLDSGADDYLIKPFDVRELQSRVRALLRRGTFLRGKHFRPLRIGPLVLDPDTHQVCVEQKTVLLTPTQWTLLYHLASHAGKVFSPAELLQQVWGYPVDAAALGLVRWHIMKLRGKIEPDPDHPTYIRTVPRHGYALMVSLGDESQSGRQTLLFG